MSAVFAEGGFKKMGFMRKLNGPPSEQRVPQEGHDAEQDIQVTGHGFNPWTDHIASVIARVPGSPALYNLLSGSQIVPAFSRV